MRSRDNQVLKLLSNNDVTFFIPPYQRNYEWGEDMCEILYKDIEKVADDNIESRNTQHFFGTVIYYAEESYLDEPAKYILVDGQQRLTTTMLFLIAIRDCLADENLRNAIDSRYLKNNNVSDDTDYKIKLKQVESDWNAYKKIILREALDEHDKHSAVYRNYSYFKKVLAEESQSKIRSLLEKGLINFNIVTIELEPERNPWEKPQEIFESMNSLGKPLSLADLVRNYLLLGKTSFEQKDLYHNYWLKIEQNLTGDSKAFSTSSFIRDYMQLIDETSYKKATDTNYKQLYREFKELFGEENHEQLLKDLAIYSNDYAILAGYKSSGNKEIDLKINDLKVIESSGFYSFVLGVLHLRTEGKIDNSGALAILDGIFTYIGRRRIIRLTQGENKNAPLFVKYLDELVEADDKKGKILELLSNQPYFLRLPNDNEIEAHLSAVGSNFYNLKSGKFIQSLIEEKLTKSRPGVTDKNLQVEHIMPRTLSETWKTELGSQFQEVHRDYLNNIGNLTLIRHNQELSNNSFKEKKEIYENNAGMQIAKDRVIDKEIWGEDQIKERAKYLIKIILDQVLPINENLKSNNNYSTEKINSSTKLSFSRLGLIGEKIVYFDDENVVAEVVSDKGVRFEDKIWKLSPLTREIETRKGRRNKSGSYWGVDKWMYQGKNLKELMQETGVKV